MTILNKLIGVGKPTLQVDNTTLWFGVQDFFLNFFSPSYQCSYQSLTKKLVFTVEGDSNNTAATDQNPRCEWHSHGVQAPVDTSIRQACHLSLKKHHQEWKRKITRAIEPKKSALSIGQGNYIHDISKMWFPKHDLNNETRWCTNMNGGEGSPVFLPIAEKLQKINGCWEKEN